MITLNNTTRDAVIVNEGKQKNMYSIPSRMARVYVAVIMSAALLITGLTAVLVDYGAFRSSGLTIVLDPGHGGSDTGAVNNELGLCEAAINLKIAIACRDRLMQYEGVNVYMTHSGVSNTYGKSSLSDRVKVVGDVGADILISLHINDASNKTAHGAEVFVPITTHEPKYNEQCTKLAEKILDRLTALGLNSRGVKTRRSGGGRIYTFSDGTKEKGDYYYVIGETISRYGVPGILVEHAFIRNDAEFLDSDSDLRAIGIADAEGIASHYGLKLKKEYSSGQIPEQTVSSDYEPPVNSESYAESENDYTSNDYTSEEDDSSELKRFENMILALPQNPTSSDANQISAVRSAYASLSETSRNQLSPELYQRMYDSVTAYENSVRQVRLAVREGSQLAIDRFNGKLLNVGTTKELSGKITVISVSVELELYVDPNAPEQYKNDGALTCRFTSPDGRELEQNDEVPDGSVLYLMYNETVLDSLIISLY